MFLYSEIVRPRIRWRSLPRPRSHQHCEFKFRLLYVLYPPISGRKERQLSSPGLLLDETRISSSETTLYPDKTKPWASMLKRREGNERRKREEREAGDGWNKGSNWWREGGQKKGRRGQEKRCHGLSNILKITLPDPSVVWNRNAKTSSKVRSGNDSQRARRDKARRRAVKEGDEIRRWAQIRGIVLEKWSETFFSKLFHLTDGLYELRELFRELRESKNCRGQRFMSEAKDIGGSCDNYMIRVKQWTTNYANGMKRDRRDLEKFSVIITLLLSSQLRNAVQYFRPLVMY